MIADFEALSTNFGETKAQFLYAYNDGTAGIRYTEAVPATAPSGYEPPAVAGERCQSVDPNKPNHVFHVVGGPFLGWGGGMGISMQHLYQDGHVCTGGDPRPDYCPPPAGLGTLDQVALDMSQWDGVALWARRGPNSQPLLRVLVGDKFTDDDISFLMYEHDPKQTRYCERVRDCSCVGDLTCGFFRAAPPLDGGVSAGSTMSLSPGYYCGVPGAESEVVVIAGPGSTGNTCNVSRCDAAFPAFDSVPNPDDPSMRMQCTAPDPNDQTKVVSVACPDRQFHGKSCTPWAFRNGSQSSFCFNPGDPPPAEPDQQCGDHFTFPLHLTTEWQLYLVPFSSMSQQGWAKKAPYFDLKSISVVRLTWDVGNIDYFIDNLRFYRTVRH